MTNKQKEKALRLRKNGVPYSEIAQRLDLSANTVKSFFRRHTPDTAVCRMCGKLISQPAGTREKRFCSDKCRMKWWNTHRDDVSERSLRDYTCAYCGAAFRAYANSRRKYCSRECYIKMRFGGGDGQN